MSTNSQKNTLKTTLSEYQIEQLYRLRDALDDLDRRASVSKFERTWRKLTRKFY